MRSNIKYVFVLFPVEFMSKWISKWSHCVLFLFYTASQTSWRFESLRFDLCWTCPEQYSLSSCLARYCDSVLLKCVSHSLEVSWSVELNKIIQKLWLSTFLYETWMWIFSSISYSVMALEKDQSQPVLKRRMITVTVVLRNLNIFMNTKPYSISIHSIIFVRQLKHICNNLIHCTTVSFRIIYICCPLLHIIKMPIYTVVGL